LTRLYSETSQQQQTQQQQDETTEQPSTTDQPYSMQTRLVDMKMSEIKAELIRMNVSFADCFDRESMEKRLLEARDGSAIVTTAHPTTSSVDIVDEPFSSSSSSSVDIRAETATTDIAEFDRASTLIELRQLSVRELKVKLSELKVRWGTMIEKEDMVQALCMSMEERYNRSKNFSRSGTLVPGSVTDVDENTLMMELGWSDVNQSIVSISGGDETNVASSTTSAAAHPPILLDVYATWCGPCQFMAPLLSKAAEELGPDVRVVKLDSDKYPRISGALKVGGLPTLIRFDGGDVSKEIQRVEGALTKDQILDFVKGDFRR
jgi:thiol-disulfide isomerase/thioredoxin